MSEEELGTNERLDDCVKTIKKLEADIDALRVDLKTTKDPEELAKISAAIGVKTELRWMEIEARDRMISKRDTVCFKCLANNTIRAARTQVLEGLPICAAHWKDYQKSNVKVEVKSTVAYTKVGDLEARIK